MPLNQRCFVKGQLCNIFNVEFPQSGALTQEQFKELESIMPPHPASYMTDMSYVSASINSYDVIYENVV